MSKSERESKPGHDHLIPEAAWRMYPEKIVTKTNWEVLESYVGHERWSGDRWAWEFLRRNRFFQRDCDVFNAELKKKTRKGPRLDRKWLLQEFKCYDEDFHSDEKNLDVPKWSIFSRVESLDTNTPIRLKGARQPWDVEDVVLQPGQIAVVLDLNGYFSLPELMKLQWASAIHKVHASASRLAKAEEEREAIASGKSAKSAPKKVSLPRRDKRIDYLRIADAFSMHYPDPLEEVCKVFHQEGRLRTGESKDTKNTEFSLTLAKNSLYKMIAATRSAIYEQGYLLLLAEAAAKAGRQDQLAPHWPRSKIRQKTPENGGWGKVKSEDDLNLSGVFSLFKKI